MGELAQLLYSLASIVVCLCLKYLCCQRSGPSVRQYNNYISPAPPLVGGYGGYGYGGGGLSIFPSYGVPLFYGGGIFNFFIFMVRICSTYH